jgi:6-phosphogluconolactonase
MRDVRVFPDTETLDAAAADHVAAAAARALRERGSFLLVLAGGTTPRGVYRRLASLDSTGLDWHRVHLFWGDERCVPPDHPQSNFAMAAASLLPAVSVPAENVHRIRGEEPAERAAAMYDLELAARFGAETPADLGGSPALDLVILGIGSDGHTASLFPGSSALVSKAWAVAARAPADADVRDRVTLTLPAIDASRECLLLATGAEKREVVRRALERHEPDARTAADLPAARVRPRERLSWYLDSDAGGSIPS